MATQKKSSTTTATKSIKRASTSSGRLHYARMAQNFLFLWLDENIDEDNNDDCRNSIIKLLKMVDTVNTFTTVDECIDFITDIKEEKAFMIISGIFSPIIVPLIQDIVQVTRFIFLQ
jgi:hypothetical protein